MDHLGMEIRQQLARYVDGGSNLNQFEDWFVPATWNIPKGDVVAIELARDVELRLAEHTNGHWTEIELKEKLLGLVAVPDPWGLLSPVTSAAIVLIATESPIWPRPAGSGSSLESSSLALR